MTRYVIKGTIIAIPFICLAIVAFTFVAIGATASRLCELLEDWAIES